MVGQLGNCIKYLTKTTAFSIKSSLLKQSFEIFSSSKEFVRQTNLPDTSALCLYSCICQTRELIWHQLTKITAEKHKILAFFWSILAVNLHILNVFFSHLYTTDVCLSCLLFCKPLDYYTLNGFNLKYLVTIFVKQLFFLTNFLKCSDVVVTFI